MDLIGGELDSGDSSSDEEDLEDAASASAKARKALQALVGKNVPVRKACVMIINSGQITMRDRKILQQLALCSDKTVTKILKAVNKRAVQLTDDPNKCMNLFFPFLDCNCLMAIGTVVWYSLI